MRKLLGTGVLSGLFLTCWGLAFLIMSLLYNIGTPMNMGPGYVPLFASIGVTAIGIAKVVAAIGGPERVPRPHWRQVSAVLAAILAFALTIRSLGLGPAAILTVIVASIAEERSRLVETAALAIATAFVAWVIFALVLGLNIPILRGFL